MSELIDREELLRIPKPFYSYQQIKEFPIVEATEVVHARWSEPEYLPFSEVMKNRMTFRVTKCGNCGAHSYAPTTARKELYCSNCGARMDRGRR